VALHEWDHRENMTSNHTNDPIDADRTAQRERTLFATRADALAEELHETDETAYPLYDGDQLDREERAALRRVQGLSTELEDIT
jgi:GTPase